MTEQNHRETSFRFADPAPDSRKCNLTLTITRDMAQCLGGVMQKLVDTSQDNEPQQVILRGWQDPQE